jgi:PAS domain S-box-containing protein
VTSTDLHNELGNYRRFFVDGPVVVFRWIATPGWPVEYVSPNVAQLFDVSAQDFQTGRVPYASCVHPDDLARVVDEVQRHSDAGVAGFDQEYRIVRPDGAVRWLFDHTLVARDDAGTITHYEGYVIDVTNHKQAQLARERMEKRLMQAQKLESLGVLAGGIAHDFNNLLAVILGNTSFALETPHLAPLLAERLLAVRKAARRGADLVEHLLAYAGRRPIAPRATDPNAVLEEMQGLLDPLVSRTSSIGYELSPDVPPITADATQVLQVVMNLVTNATESLGPSGGDVLVSTGLIRADEAYLASAVAGAGLASGDYACIEVADSGCGMDGPTLARIFDPFFTTKQTGRGLGLAAVLGIVRAHGGALRVQSSPGCGSRFTVLFPPLRSGEVTGDSQRAAGGTGPASSVILVVDDDEDVRGVLEQTLCRAGFEVLSAGGGRRALDILRSKEREISAVLIDLVMAHMDGVETLRAMRRERADVPAILVSGFTGDERIARFRELGFQDFVQKPFKPEALLASLRAVLSGQPIAGSPATATPSHTARAGR